MSRLLGIADEYGTIWAGEPGASERIGDLIQRPDEETSEVRLAGRDARPRLTFAQAANEIRDLLDDLGNAPHEEHFGAFCPICGLVTSLRAKLEDWRP